MKLSSTLAVVLSLCASAAARAQTVAPSAAAPQLPGESAAAVSFSPSAAAAQDLFLGGVPTGKLQPGTIPLSLSDAIERGLKYNLGALIASDETREARGARWKALANLLPQVTTGTSETREQVNLEAFGFAGFPRRRAIEGPFGVFDTRAYLSQTILDFNALHKLREESAKAQAADYSYQNARDLVVLVCANLYLESVADASRVRAAEVQVKTAQALYDRAVDLKKAGVVPGIDVLRAQVELQAQKQRLIFFQNDFEKQKLTLARAIGLPIGQAYKLTDSIPYAPMAPLPLDRALERAYRSRADYQAALALVKAAESAKQAARGDALPSLQFDGNYGDIGRAPDRSHGTFLVAATLKVPIFQGGRVHGEILQAGARLRERQEEREDLRARIAYQVQTALMDLKSTGERVEVAKNALDLAHEQMKEAQDRFSAGVVSSLEVVQSQDAVATADENYISSLCGYNVAKASLARALGVAEKAYREFLGGKP